MTLMIAIKVIATCIIVLALICFAVYLYNRSAGPCPKFTHPSYSDQAIACLRSDPHIARIVLTLTHLERSNDKGHVRRKRNFLFLELISRLKLHIDDKSELKHVCYELVRMAVTISKARDEQLRKS